MEARQPSCAGIIAVNLTVIVVILLLVELGFRHLMPNVPDVDPHPVIWMQFTPYVMTSNGKTHWKRWHDTFRGKMIDADVVSNNYGFPMREDFQITAPYKKALNEKVVLFTGGSTAWGVGASSNAAIIHEKLASILNEAQQDTRYTVINLAMGGWIAQQQEIALSIWGRLYNPDWVIAMDGANDASVGCAMSQGTGNPVHYQIMKSYIDGYLGTQQNPSYYRSDFENQLILHSATYRTLTKKQYIPREQAFDPTVLGTLGNSSQLLVITPTSLSELRNQLTFYLLAQRSILERFQDAKFILSTQPWQQDFGFIFGEFYTHASGSTERLKGQENYEDELEKWLDFYKPTENLCSGEKVGIALRYVFGMSAVKLSRLVDEYRQSRRRDVEYYNLGLLFPKDVEKRNEYFTDLAHLNDSGLEKVARYYAHNILRRDFPARDWDSLRPQALWLQ